MGFKQCTKCGEVKPLHAFSAKRRVCKPCRCEYTKAWIAENQDKYLAGAAKRRETSRLWALAHPDRVVEAWRKHQATKPEQCRARAKRWRLANPDVMAAAESKRRASIRGATPSWAEIDAIKLVYAKAKQYRMCVDHIVPLRGKIVCGLHVHANLQLLERHENQLKMNIAWPDMPTDPA